MNALLAYLEKPANWYVDRGALAALVALALIVRFHGITRPEIWLDEAFSVLLARYEPWQIWSITAKDVHPPLYYLALHYWIILFGDGVMAVRSLSAVADVGTVLLSIKLMSLVATPRATWIAALLLALLPISVRYSQEARMYTLLGFWLMGATVALVCWVKDSESKLAPAIYVLFMVAAFYTHYFAALCVLVHWFYWWWARGRAHHAMPPRRRWMLANGTIALLFVPWLPHFIDHLANRPQWMPPVTVQAVLSLVWDFTVMNGRGEPSLSLRALPLVLVIACAVVLVWKDNCQHQSSGLLLGYFFIPAVALVSLALFGPMFAPRYLVFAAVGLPLIIAVALDAVARHPAILILAVASVVTLQLHGLRSVYLQLDDLNGTDLRRDIGLDRLAQEIEQVARPNDEIILDSLFWYLPFDYYNQTGIRPRLQIAPPLEAFLKVADRGGFAVIPESSRWIYFVDPDVLKCKGRRVWWVTIQSAPAAKTLSAEDWDKTLTIRGGKAAATLFTLKAAPFSAEAGDQANVTQSPLFATGKCPSN